MKKSILTRSHEIIVVTTPTLAALRSARALMQEIKKLHGGSAANVDLILNMAGLAPGKEVPKNDIKNALDLEPGAIIPFDSKLFIGVENEGKKLSSEKAGQDIIQKLLPLIQKITARDTSAANDVADEGLFGSIMSKLKTKN